MKNQNITWPSPLSVAVGSSWKQYAAGGPYNLLTDSPDGTSAARLIVMLAAGDLSACVTEAGLARPLTGLPAGYQHLGSTASVTTTVGIVVYW